MTRRATRGLPGGPQPQIQLGSTRHLQAIVSSHQLRRGRVTPDEVVQELYTWAVARRADADAALADIERMRELANGIHDGSITLPEAQPLEEVARERRLRLMEA